MNSYEVEIKSLLGAKENADLLLEKLKADPSFVAHGEHKQLNHYFIGGDLTRLYENAEMHIAEDKRDVFKQLCYDAKEFSVRTRKADEKVILVIKASVDDTTSSNGTARLEFESEVNMSLEELDKILIESGFSYQAKWSRERQEYTYKGMNVSIDKNAGYGYLAEFEKISDDASRVEGIKDEIRNAMSEIGLMELPQDRLARMFEYYNNNWEDYYGTDKVFNIE
ncbi:MAG: CYTH domain-containing protein [Candidatus Doudnabacteria bacterium]|nr:CYTH domain-containing protein [Candidatus Doudnabacteria bacterium]